MSKDKDYGDGGHERVRKLIMQGMLALPCICRSVYAEAVELLYSVPTILIDHVQTLLWWKEDVLVDRFATIRSLDLKSGLVGDYTLAAGAGGGG